MKLRVYYNKDKIMPVYEYRCESCGHKNSFLEPVGGEKTSFFASLLGKGKKCEKCSGKKLERVISSVSVHKTQTQQEVINDLRKIAPVQFVPDARPRVSPENCPNCHGNPSLETSSAKKSNRIVTD